MYILNNNNILFIYILNKMQLPRYKINIFMKYFWSKQKLIYKNVTWGLFIKFKAIEVCIESNGGVAEIEKSFYRFASFNTKA